MSGDLFDHAADTGGDALKPLAERMRPQRLDAFVGQSEVVGEGTLLYRAIREDRLFSMILWGPPGCGKTTLARIVAKETRARFIEFSAVLSGVRQIRAVIEEAREEMRLRRRRTILFVDEIHRFNKAQQDAFLPHVESGRILLIGSTTENPSFEIIPALMSRCRVIRLHRLTPEEIAEVLRRALSDTERGLASISLTLDEDALLLLVQLSDGDARAALNALEAVAAMYATDNTAAAPVSLSAETLQKVLQRKALLHDKAGESHFNLISALHKSLRDSDPDGALYWLARMLAAGEDPLYILRRMVRFASEDVGNADPAALRVAMDATEAFRFLGPPEGELAVAQAALYLATAPKSNSVYRAYDAVCRAVQTSGSLPVPLHLRNAPTRLMKAFGYGKGYQYAHDDPNAVVSQEHLPPELKGRRFYRPTDRGYEKAVRRRLEFWSQLKHGAIDDKKQKPF